MIERFLVWLQTILKQVGSWFAATDGWTLLGLALFLPAGLGLAALLARAAGLRRRGSPADTPLSMRGGEAATDTREPSDTIGAYLVAGNVLAALLVLGIGGWAATAELAGAVLAQGTIVVDGKLKKVQHPTGGVVGEIRVKDGDAVKAGDVLMRLDATVTQANLDSVTKQLDELSVREARLRAELAGADTIAWPQDFASRVYEPTLAAIMAAERALLQSRAAARAGQRAQLRERIAQLRAQVAGLDGQNTAKAAEVDLANKELLRLRSLEAAKLVPETKMTDTRRDLNRLKGEAAQIQSSIAEANGKIAETELQILQLDDDMRNEDGKDLREVQGKVAELIERKISAEDQLRRIEIRAPQSGIVHQLSVHTVGGVIGQGETLMEIVPEDDRLVIEAKVSPNDIDHVRVDQNAFVRLPAFNQRTTPELAGTVNLVSADVARDAGSGPQNPPYFLVRVSLAPEALTKLGSLKLLPGMPAEVHIETPKRTALSYLVKPLRDQIALAFNER